MAKTALQRAKALADAKALAKTAGAAHDAKPDDPTARATYLGALSAVLSIANATAKADKGARAAMKKVTEKYSEKKERLEETDMEEEEESVPATTPSSDASSDGSAPGSQDEEEEESGPPMSSEEEEEEEAAAPKGKGIKGESEEEEEEAIAKGWKAAHAAYKSATKGVDAYAIHGPRALLKATQKSTGQASILGTFGALAAAPRAAKANATIAADVQKLKADATRAKVDAIVQQAKADGRAGSKTFRAKLRADGAKFGATWLAGFVATLPKMGRTTREGAFVPREGTDGDGGAPGVEAQAMMEKMMAGLDEKGRAEFLEIAAKKQKALNGAGGTR